jgi:hypothetical protein
MSITSSLTSAQFKQAAELKEKIEALHQELAALLAGEDSAPVATPVAAEAEEEEVAVRPRKKSKFTAEGLARLKAAQKARWARIHAEKAAKAAKATKADKAEKADKPAKKTRKMSKAGRAKIAAGARARWARVRAEKAGL